MTALDIQNLVKIYQNDTYALRGIDLKVEQGDFFALLGPNGAGKSSAIGIVSSMVNKSSGSVYVFGHDLDTEVVAAKACIGLVPQEFNFNGFEPIMNTITNVAGYNGIPLREAKKRAEHYLKRLDLWDKRGAAGRELSGGMKRRLMIARALVHEPRMLILDEPTAGVDIEIRRSMWEYLTEINEQNGITVILTTHYLEEAEALCRNVAIIDKGQIIENGAVADLLSQAVLETFVLTLYNNIDTLPDIAPFTIRRRNEPNQIEVDVPKGESVTAMIDALNQKEFVVGSIRTKSNRLEEFFLRLVGQSDDQRQADGQEPDASVDNDGATR